MSFCPLCNGFEVYVEHCPTCNQLLEDKGRVIDYFDDYSPYMEIDDMKKLDGYEQTLQRNQCAHVLFCVLCNAEQVVFIQE